MTMTLARVFRSDPLCHDDVRPFNIWGLPAAVGALPTKLHTHFGQGG